MKALKWYFTNRCVRSVTLQLAFLKVCEVFLFPINWCKISAIILTFLLEACSSGIPWIFFRHFSIFYFPIIKRISIRIFLVPSEFTESNTVKQSLLFFPPLQAVLKKLNTLIVKLPFKYKSVLSLDNRKGRSCLR